MLSKSAVIKLILTLMLEVFATGIFYKSLFFVELGPSSSLILLAVVITAFLFAAYLSAETFARIDFREFSFFRPSVQRFVLAKRVFFSLIPCFVFITICVTVLLIFSRWSISLSFMAVVKVYLIVLIYTLVGASIGILGWRISGRTTLATLFALMVWGVLIGSFFSLVPIERYVGNLASFIPVFLHVNPLISVCHVLEHDIFRTPKLYELTPISSYLFVYPKWYLICGWQVLIGIFCLLLYYVLD